MHDPEDDIFRAKPLRRLIELSEIAPPHNAGAKYFRGSRLVIDGEIDVDVIQMVELENLTPDIRNAPRTGIGVKPYVWSLSCNLNPLLDIVRVKEITRHVDTEIASVRNRLDHVIDKSRMEDDIVIARILVFDSLVSRKVYRIAFFAAKGSRAGARFDGGKIEREARRFCVPFADMVKVGSHV